MSKKNQSEGNKWLRKAAIIIAWLIAWQIISVCVDNTILLVGPVTTFGVLLEKVAEISFWKTVLMSIIRIIAGFLAGWLLGLLLAAASGWSRMTAFDGQIQWVEEALKPIMTLIKTVPVASFVVLFLIWFRTDVLAVVISMFVVLPNVYFSTLEGIKNTDTKLLEMASVYELHPIDKFFYIYRPALKPFWDSCMKLSIGMCWKSGVAAEVIATPDFSIGEQLYMSKIYLDTAGVLAWTVVIILISTLCEKIFLKLWGRFLEWQPGCKGVREAGSVAETQKKDAENAVAVPIAVAAPVISQELLCIRDLSKSYGENQLFAKFCAEYKSGHIYYFRAPSGSGKTTLFRMIAGLEKPDEGQIIINDKIAHCFQENRLCESYSALKNLELVCGDATESYRYLTPLLDEEDLYKPCCRLSGGMKRRVEVARAFAAKRKVVLLDEPFAGLDEENLRKMQRYIEEYGKDKAVLIASHVSLD